MYSVYTLPAVLHSSWCFFPHVLEKAHLVIDMQTFLDSLSFFFSSPALCLAFSIRIGPYLNFALLHHVPPVLTMCRASQIIILFFKHKQLFLTKHHNSEQFSRKGKPHVQVRL